MSKKAKLLQRTQNSPKNLRFLDFCTLMEYFGFTLVRMRGSHHLYQHPKIEEVMNVQPKKDGLAKAYQVQQFLKLIETHQLTLVDTNQEEE
ncbi:MAG: type II toxin-antitoxin system HicA family toxin [bacterium]|nr:type II toxin-antitoxin system HicA family toxin [bacterium]